MVGLGEALWDTFIPYDGAPVRRLGGAPANFAYHAAQLGLPALALSAVGSDAAGDGLAAALKTAGVPALLQRVPQPTGQVAITLGASGVPRYEFTADCAWDHLAATAEWRDIAARTRLVCFGSLAQRSAASRAAVAAFLDAMPQGEGTWRVFDINLRRHFYTHELLRVSLRAADVLKINDDELETLARMEGIGALSQLDQARLLMERYALRLLILTCGALGSYVLGQGGDALSYEPAPQVHVVDTVGAGDAFTAAFMASLLRGDSLPQAHRRAGELAAYVCTLAGAMPPVPAAFRLS